MRFLADMGISPATVRDLREQGYPAIHLMEEDLARLADAQILLKARREQRIVLTSDLDFGELLAAGQYELPSVIIFRLQDMRPGNVNRHLKQILSQHAASLERGAVLSVTERRTRVRALPIR